MTNDAQELLDRIKAGERLQVTDFHEGSDNALAANELMKAGLIETHALVWETRVCYVPAGLDPRREALETVLEDWLDDNRLVGARDEFIDELLAVLS